VFRLNITIEADIILFCFRGTVLGLSSAAWLKSRNLFQKSSNGFKRLVLGTSRLAGPYNKF
jgi:hypothetical protein